MAAAKKDFSKINTTVVSNSISQATSARIKQEPADAEEKAERENTGRTQGRKGCKLTRINFGMTPDNHQFVKIMSQASGQTMGGFINHIIAAYRAEHPEIMEQANAFLKTINSGAFSSLLESDITGYITDTEQKHIDDNN